jgi:hypothetical protein
VCRYAEAIEACALAHDLSLLPDGDRTHIGELGINLSGTYAEIAEHVAMKLVSYVYHTIRGHDSDSVRYDILVGDHSD